ncbi:MAG: NHLP bacteriocin system secretion protein [Phycisphaerales bacterium]
MPTFQLISTPRWIWLASLVLCVVSGVLYGIFGEITRTVSGVGVTRQGLDVLTIAATRSGAVASVHVKPGDELVPGDLVAMLRTNVIDAEIARIRDRITLLLAESAELEKIEDTTIHDAEVARDAALRESQEVVSTTKDLLDRRNEFLAQQEELLKEGLLAGETILRSRAQVAELQNAMEAAQSAEAEARLRVTRLKSEFAADRAARREQIALANAELTVLERRRENEYGIRTDVAGQVDDMPIEVGDYVEAGDRLFKLLPPSTSGALLQVVAFLPQGTGKVALAGDRVQLAPRFADPSRYGYMEGRLTSISELAAIPKELSELIGNPLIVSQLLERQALVAEISLELDPATPSGLKWSSIVGWPGKIGPGVILDVEIVYQVDRPIDLFLPWIRSLLGQ